MEERWAAPTLHRSTEPAAIERRQRRDVRKALKVLGKAASVAEISEATCLPEFNVLRALGLYTQPQLRPAAKTNRMTLGKR